MATNRRFPDQKKTRELPVPSGWVSGRPVCVGQIPGVCLTSRDADLTATVQLDGSFNLHVEGIDSSGTSGADANVAVAVGDKLYYDGTPTNSGIYLSKRAGGIFFGYAEGTLDSGDDGTISVMIGY